MKTYIKTSVPRPAGSPGKGITPKDVLTLIDVEDIVSFPPRDGAGVVLVGDIAVKPSAYSVDLYITPGTVELASNGEGETDAKGFTPSVKGKHPGNKREVREFKTNWLGRHCIAILQYCNGEPADIIGSPCNPIEMSVNYTGNKDANSSEFTFTQISKGDDIARRTPGSSSGGCNGNNLQRYRAISAKCRSCENSNCYRCSTWRRLNVDWYYGWCCTNSRNRRFVCLFIASW